MHGLTCRGAIGFVQIYIQSAEIVTWKEISQWKIARNCFLNLPPKHTAMVRAKHTEENTTREQLNISLPAKIKWDPYYHTASLLLEMNSLKIIIPCHNAQNMNMGEFCEITSNSYEAEQSYPVVGPM